LFTIRSIDNYGGQFEDALPVEDPETEQAAADHNRMAEDVAQVTGSAPKWWISWPTLNGAGTVSAASVSVRSHYGTGSAAKPTIVRGATAGRYTLTFAASYVDGIAATETTALFGVIGGTVQSATVFGVITGSTSGVVATIQIWDAAGAATDLTLGTNVMVGII
jgi:hypothetical protein